MAKARVPAIARWIAVSMEVVARKVIVVIPFAVSELVVKVKIAARSVNNREMVTSRATASDTRT